MFCLAWFGKPREILLGLECALDFKTLRTMRTRTSFKAELAKLWVNSETEQLRVDQHQLAGFLTESTEGFLFLATSLKHAVYFGKQLIHKTQERKQLPPNWPPGQLQAGSIWPLALARYPFCGSGKTRS